MHGDTLVVTPTRERRENAERLIRAIGRTASAGVNLVLAVDDDDHSYDGMELPSWAEMIRGPRADVAGWTNRIAVDRADGWDLLVSMGDDHEPQTPGWDVMFHAALHGRPGVAYGNDLWQRERWPTAAAVSSQVVAALGYMAPPGPAHLYIDCFWRRLGEDLGCLEYLDDVIIEHLHPHAGKAAWDASYMRSNSITQYSRDEAAYDAFLAGQWPADLERLKEKLGL